MAYLRSLTLIFLAAIPLTVNAQTNGRSEDPAFIKLGHGSVTSLSWNPQSDVIAVGSEEGISFHNADLEPLYFAPEYQPVEELSWNPTGDQLAVRWRDIHDTDGYVYRLREGIWDVGVQQFVTAIDSDQDTFSFLPFSWCPDQNNLVRLDGSQILLWNVSTGNISTSINTAEAIRAFTCVDDHSVKVITESCHILTYSPDQTPASDVPFLQHACPDSAYQLIHTSRHFEYPTFQWDHSGQRFLYRGPDHTLGIIDSITGEVVSRLEGHTDDILTAVWMPDDHSIITTSVDGSMLLWDAATGQPLQTLVQNSSPITILAVDPTGQQLVTYNQESVLQVWDLPTVQVTAEYDEYLGWSEIRWGADGRHLLTHAHQSTRNQIWDAETGDLIRTVNAPFVNDEPLAYLPHSNNLPSWTAGGDQFAAFLDHGTVGIFDRDSDKPRFVLAISGIPIQSFAWNPEGTILATYAWGEHAWESETNAQNPHRGIWLWDGLTGDSLGLLPGSQIDSLTFTWSPEGSRIVFTSHYTANSRLTIMNIASKKKEIEIDLPVTVDPPLFWTPDGSEIMTGYTDQFGGVLFWYRATGKLMYQHTTGGLSVLNPNGRLFASPAGELYTSAFTVWDRQTDRLVARYEPPYGTDFSITWSPSGDRFATQTLQGPVLIINTAPSTDRQD